MSDKDLVTVIFMCGVKVIHEQQMAVIPRIGETIDLADLAEDTENGIIGEVVSVWWQPFKNKIEIYLKDIPK